MFYVNLLWPTAPAGAGSLVPLD